MIAQRYSKQTLIQYAGSMIKYYEYINRKPLNDHKVDDVNRYLTEISKDDVSESYINRSFSAIKFYYEKVAYLPDFELNRMRRPRKGRYLPTILSTSEVNRILASCPNLKHTTILYTLYSSGIRLNELLNLKIDDISWDRNQIHVKSGKGNKDRIVMLGQALKQILSWYTDKYKPMLWLFEGADGKSQYSASSVQKVVKQAAYKAKITKRVTPHTIRHCFATHLMDGGTDVRYIQELLGHKDIKTTLIYTHVTTRQLGTIVSPLDRLEGLKFEKE